MLTESNNKYTASNIVEWSSNADQLVECKLTEETGVHRESLPQRHFLHHIPHELTSNLDRLDGKPYVK